MPRPPRLGELRLGVIKAGREAMTRQRWRDDCAGDRPLPGAIVGHAAAGLENPADVAAMGINHVVVVRAPGARAALAGVAQDQWSADRLPHDRVMSQCSNSGWLGSPRAPRCSSPEARWLSDNARRPKGAPAGALRTKLACLSDQPRRCSLGRLDCRSRLAIGEGCATAVLSRHRATTSIPEEPMTASRLP
jgi:hypothetical protein